MPRAVTYVSFSKLDQQIQKALSEVGYTSPTPIQQQAIPLLLNNKDLIGIAQTGTGKTAAFVLPLLHYLTTKKKAAIPHRPRSLILAPTRELAAQIHDSIKTYGKHLKLNSAVIFGGVGQHPQVKALASGLDILVATPGRLLDLKQQGRLKLDNVEYFVLDEADRMLDMGFIHDVKNIIATLPPKRHSLFFSATMSPELEKLASTLLHNPERVEITPQATTVERIQQHILFVDQKNKDNLLLHLLEGEHLDRVLVFSKMKHRANKIALLLKKRRINADAIHGDKTQTARTKALASFRSGKCRVLVATDIAARGIDIDNISHVINYDLPMEPESYVHRIGRTARAGTEGTAYSFCSAEERHLLRNIEKLTKQSIQEMEHPFFSEAAKNAKSAPSQHRRRRPNTAHRTSQEPRSNTRRSREAASQRRSRSSHRGARKRHSR